MVSTPCGRKAWRELTLFYTVWDKVQEENPTMLIKYLNKRKSQKVTLSKPYKWFFFTTKVIDILRHLCFQIQIKEITSQDSWALTCFKFNWSRHCAAVLCLHLAEINMFEFLIIPNFFLSWCCIFVPIKLSYIVLLKKF